MPSVFSRNLPISSLKKGSVADCETPDFVDVASPSVKFYQSDEYFSNLLYKLHEIFIFILAILYLIEVRLISFLKEISREK